MCKEVQGIIPFFSGRNIDIVEPSDTCRTFFVRILTGLGLFLRVLEHCSGSLTRAKCPSAFGLGDFDLNSETLALLQPVLNLKHLNVLALAGDVARRQHDLLGRLSCSSERMQKSVSIGQREEHSSLKLSRYFIF